MKKYLFPLSIILIMLTYACNNSPDNNATCIEKVIAADAKLGTVRNHACKQVKISQVVRDYVAKLEAIDYTDCPQLFVQKFKSHISAWKAVLKITDKYPKLRGEMHDIFDDIEAGTDGVEFKVLVKDIWDTWGEVEVEIEKEKAQNS